MPYRPKTLSEVSREVEQEFLDVQRGVKKRWPSTGFRALDKMLGGLPPTLVVLGAHPGVGKSAFLAGMIRCLAKAQTPIGMFSLEDRASWLVWRYLALETGLNQITLRSQGLSQEARVAAQSGFSEIARYGERIYLDDRPSLSPREIVAAAKQMIAEHGVECLMVDHLGELRYGTARGERYDLDLAEGLSQLRAIANEHNVPVVCACHLTRISQEREHPALSDFANSAAIERQARLALVLTRKESEPDLTCYVLKNTLGPHSMFCKIPFVASAAVAIETRTGLRSVASDD